MKLKEYLKNDNKVIAYGSYERIVFNVKEYDNITRSKMADEIIKELQLKNFIFNICTEKELKILKKIKNNKLSEKDKETYFWELNQLHDKLIIDNNCNIFEELTEAVDNTLKIKIGNPERGLKEFNELVVGLVRTHANMLLIPLKSILKEIYNIKEDEIEDLIFSSPFIHYYCYIYDKYVESLGKYETLLYYRDYEAIIDIIDEKRQEYGIAGKLAFSIDAFLDMFYYGMPIDNPITRKLYKKIVDSPYRDLLFPCVDTCRLLNDEEYMELLHGLIDDKFEKLIKEGLKEMPCAVMNSFTPKQYYKEKEEELINNIKFTHVIQNDAHLPKKGADEFYKIYFAILEYANNKYKINSNIDKIYKQEGLNARGLVDINNYIFDNKNVLDEFIKDNIYNFNKEELEIIEGFKTAVKNEHFIVVGYERDYTKILSPEDGKIYMVKGVRDNLDRVLKNYDLPIIINTTLIMFKGRIIYNSFLSNFDIKFGNDVKKMIIKDYDESMEYYHL